MKSINFAICKNLKEVEKELNSSLGKYYGQEIGIIWHAALTYDTKLRRFKLYSIKDESGFYDFSINSVKKCLPNTEVMCDRLLEMDHAVYEIMEADPRIAVRVKKIHVNIQMKDYLIGEFIHKIFNVLGYPLNYKNSSIDYVKQNLNDNFGASEEQAKQYIEYITHNKIMKIGDDQKLMVVKNEQ